VNIYTKPHATYAVVPVPLKEWQDDHADAYLEPVAANIEAVWKSQEISGASFVQDVDENSQLLASFIDFTVAYQPSPATGLPFTTVVRVPLDALSSITAFTAAGSDDPYALRLVQAYEQLRKTAST
jgi:hypothetical protein